MTDKKRQEKKSFSYLACEQRGVYELLMLAAGMMGAYTFILRGGVFCNAQTANFVMMGIALGNKDWSGGLYYLIPAFAYFGGSFLSELLPRPVRRIGLLRWDTYLIGIEILALFIIGLIPLTMPHQIVQVTVNFICSMQYNTFRQAQGIPMATTFCTNHVRQVGIAAAKFIRKKDREAVKRGMIHASMIGSFLLGGVLMTVASNLAGAKAIWLALIPLLVNFGRLAYADLVSEQGQLDRKPAGH